jgi:hypothetical protein
MGLDVAGESSRGELPVSRVAWVDAASAPREDAE